MGKNQLGITDNDITSGLLDDIIRTTYGSEPSNNSGLLMTSPGLSDWSGQAWPESTGHNTQYPDFSILHSGRASLPSDKSGKFTIFPSLSGTDIMVSVQGATPQPFL